MSDVVATRGVHYFDGRVRCPLAGLGSRGDYASNRLVLDDDGAEVTLDRAAGRITIRDERRTTSKRALADLMFLADGTTPAGRQIPFGIHLKVFREGDRISIDLHRHMRNQEHLASAEFEPFEVVVTDGQRREVVLEEARVRRLVSKPSLALRAVKALMSMKSNLDGVVQDPARPGFRVADLSLGFGGGPLTWKMVRAQLASLSGDNAPLIRGGSVVEMLEGGAWELSLTAYTEKYVADVIKRDIFLFGLGEVPLLAEVGERGLPRGQTLGFRFERGRGEVVLGQASAELPDAIDVARAYLEFHMLGGLLVEESERIRKTLA